MSLRRLSLLSLLCILIFQAGVPRLPSSAPRLPPKAQAKQLARGQSVERKLLSGEEHTYWVSLSTGDFLLAQVKQRGIDAVVALLDPKGRRELRMDSPNGRRGAEYVCAVAKMAGNYLLKVTGAGTGWRGSYQISIQNVRQATKADRACDAGLRMLAEGDAIKQEQPEEAIARYRAALRTWALVGDASGQVKALERLGDLFEAHQRQLEALSSYDAALPLARSIEDRGAETRLAIRSGLMLLYSGDLSQAESRLRRGLKLAEEDEDLFWEAQAHNNLAIIQRFSGEMPQALESYSRAQKLWDDLVEPAEGARTHANRGALLLAVGQPRLALAAFNQALRLLKLEERVDVRRAVLSNAALAFHLLGDRRRAFLTYWQALRLAQKSRDRAVILGRVAVLFQDEDDPRKVAAFEETLRLARLQGDRRTEAYTLAELAHIEHVRGRELKAIQGFEQALGILERMQDPAVMASVLFGRAEAERGLGRRNEAIASVESSISQIESLRSRLPDPEFRVTFFADRHRYYVLYVDLLLDNDHWNPGSGFDVKAFEATERSQGRSLLDDMAGEPVAAAMSLAEIQREVVDGDSLLLSYRLGETHSVLWAITPDSMSMFKLAPRAEIEEAAIKVARRWAAGEWTSEVAALSSMLFPSGLAPLGQKRLLIIPDGALHLLPFSALCDPWLPAGCRPRAPIVLEHEIAYLPSASVLGRMRRKFAGRGVSPTSIAVFADPVFQRGDERLIKRIGEVGPREVEIPLGFGLEGLQRLRYTHGEGREILAMFPPQARNGFFDFAANREALKNPAVAASRILHLATHNLISDRSDLSGLVLSRFDEKGHPTDGFVGAREIYGLTLQAELVVLSACGTGLGKEIRGEGLVGLSRAFLHAGARRVVVSLWDVRERETFQLMVRFYSGLRDGLSPSAALQFAQASMLSEGRPPRAWAAFALWGEAR